MDGRILAESFVSVKGTQLRMLYIWFCRTSIFQLLSSKAKGVIGKESDNHLSKHIEVQMEVLKETPDEVLQMDLFLECARLLKLNGFNIGTEADVEEKCEEFINWAYDHVYKHDSSFEGFCKRESYSTMLEELLRFQMSKYFGELNVCFDDLTESDIRTFTNHIQAAIPNLAEGVVKNTTFKKKLLPIILMELVLAYLQKGIQAAALQPLLDERNRRWRNYLTVISEIQQTEQVLSDAHGHIIHNERKIREIEKRISEFKRLKGIEWQKVYASLHIVNMNKLSISRSFEEHLGKYQQARKRVREIEHSRKRYADKGVIRFLSHQFSNMSKNVDLYNEKKQVDYWLKKLVDDVLASNSSFQQEVREQINQLDHRISVDQSAKQRLEKRIKALKQEEKQLTVRVQKLEEQKEELEQHNHGLIVVSSEEEVTL